jgi:hypothetical protein
MQEKLENCLSQLNIFSVFYKTRNNLKVINFEKGTLKLHNEKKMEVESRFLLCLLVLQFPAFLHEIGMPE